MQNRQRSVRYGIGYMLEFLGENKSDESITYILDEVDDTPERRAKMLLGEILIMCLRVINRSLVEETYEA